MFRQKFFLLLFWLYQCAPSLSEARRQLRNCCRLWRRKAAEKLLAHTQIHAIDIALNAPSGYGTQMRKSISKLEAFSNEHHTQRAEAQEKRNEAEEKEKKTKTEIIRRTSYISICATGALVSICHTLWRVVKEPKACAGYIKAIKGIYILRFNFKQVYDRELVYPPIYRTLSQRNAKKKNAEWMKRDFEKNNTKYFNFHYMHKYMICE